jgi:predicted acylesterase/phospholipase RssA
LAPTSIAFGATTVGTWSGLQAVTMTNTGTAALSITSIAVTGANASQFVFANTCGTSLAVGASCSIHGHFQPTSTGAMSAAIAITDSAANSPQSISLSGTGQ